MDIQGKVHEITPTQELSEKFRKRELVLEYAENPQYPEYIKFEAHNDKCEKLDELRVGDTITVHFNLRGRPWTDKNGKTSYFNTLALWKFDANQTTGHAQPEYTPPIDVSSAPQDDDLPF